MAYFPTKVLDNQIKALPTVSTASGSVANFTTDMQENLVEVECEIVYSQASGTPSPSNPLPITTYSEISIGHNSGKNIAELSDVTLNNFQNCNRAYQDNGVELTVTGAYGRAMYKIPVIVGKTYTISYKCSKDSDFGRILYASQPKWTGDYGTQNTTETETLYTKTFTAITSDIYLGFYASANVTSGTMTIKDFMIEEGLTASSFEQFSGHAYNIPFGQTVAQGTLNVSTGVLRVTHGVVDLGSLNYSQGFSGFYTTGIKDFIEIPSTVADSQLLCSIFSVGNTANNDNMYIQFAPSYLGWVVFLPSTSYATASDFKTAMSGINLVYKLATPQEIQLDSTQITALLNENNIWCDTGDTSVKFILSVGEYVNQNV